MVTTQEVADTIALLLPGFVALKVFYQFGLKTKRTDLHWTLWSVLVAFLLAPVTRWVHDDLNVPIDPIWLGLGVGLAAGVLGVVVWDAVLRRRPDFRLRVAPTVWDIVLRQPGWVQVATTDGRVLLGTIDQMTDTSETDDHDIYLTRASWVLEDGTTKELAGQGVWIDRSHIQYIQLWPDPPAESDPDASRVSTSEPIEVRQQEH
jgi:hypothetical protein